MSGTDWKKECLKLAHQYAISNLDLGILLTTYEKNMRLAGLFSDEQKKFCDDIRLRIEGRDLELDKFENTFKNEMRKSINEKIV